MRRHSIKSRFFRLRQVTMMGESDCELTVMVISKKTMTSGVIHSKSIKVVTKRSFGALKSQGKTLPSP